MSTNGGFSPALNLPHRKVKGLIKLFGGLSSPFHYTVVTVEEGIAMVADEVTSLAAEHMPQRMRPAQPTEGAKVIGLSMQQTYDDGDLSGPFAQLKNYHFANDTAQQLNGMPIGLLTGHGYAYLRNYLGDVTAGGQAYVGTSGILTGSGDADDKLPVIFETTQTGGVANDPKSNAPVRIRFDFPLAPQS